MDLTCLFFSDIPRWERDALRPIVDWFARNHRVEVRHVTGDRRLRPGSILPSENLWVVTRQWRSCLRALKRVPARRTFLSVFNLGNLHPSLPTLFLRRFQPPIPRSVHVLAHCPLNARFFREIEGVEESRVSLLPLPFPVLRPPRPEARRPFTVGTIALFNREANLNYFVGVAHYVRQRDPGIRFRILGTGRLLGHVQAMVDELGLADGIDVVDSSTSEGLSSLDLLIYAPLRNDHFVPVLLAGSHRLPVIASELPGIEDFITEGRDGYVLPINETKPMGELTLRLSREPELRAAFGERLTSSLSQKFGIERVAEVFGALFFGGGASRAAA